MGKGIRRGSAIAVIGAIVAFATIVPAELAVAGEITEFATDADDLLQQGKPQAALDAFNKATDAFWAASPLQVRTALFAASITGFGQYEPRADNKFRSGDTATIYAEPVGYGFTSGDDAFTAAFTAGIEMRTAGGLVLAKVDDFGRLEWHGRTKSHAIHLAVNVVLPTLKPGDYRLVLTLTDAATAKAAAITLPFSIGE